MAFFYDILYTINGDGKMNKEINKKLIILPIIGLILFIIALIIPKLNIIRLTLTIISIVLITIYIKEKFNFKIGGTILTILIVLIMTICLDGLNVLAFKKVPIYSYNIINNKNITIYNSFGLRVWQCDKNKYDNLIVSPFYEKGYKCDTNDITPTDANSFLNAIVQNHKEYYNSYAKIVGKISKKSGQNLIEMQPYKESTNSINGYIEFADNITLRFLFDNEPSLDDYDVFDEITILGLIKNMEKENGKYVIYMDDCKVIGDINTIDYTISITSKSCKDEPNLIYQDEENDVYTQCIDNAVVSYPSNKYELPQALSSNKISVKDLYRNFKKEDKDPENNTTIYRLRDYAVVVCDKEMSKDVYITKPNIDFKDITCKILEEKNK